MTPTPSEPSRSVLGRLWQSHRMAVTGFVLAATITVFFLVRLAIHAVYWSDPAHRHMVPQPWMTVGFIARSWNLEGRAIDQAAGFPSPDQSNGHPLTLEQIAKQRGVPVAEVITVLEAVILTMQAQEPNK